MVQFVCTHPWLISNQLNNHLYWLYYWRKGVGIHIHMTFNQQFYKPLIDIKWLFNWHLLMSFQKVFPRNCQTSARFLRGEHMTQHVKGYWNKIWSDMFIETTFTQYGKGPNGLIGFIFKPRSVKRWVHSLIACPISQLTRLWKHARKTEGPRKAS